MLAKAVFSRVVETPFATFTFCRLHFSELKFQKKFRSGTMICASDFWRIFSLLSRIDRKSSTPTNPQNPQQCVEETIHILQSFPLMVRFKFIIYLQKCVTWQQMP